MQKQSPIRLNIVLCLRIKGVSLGVYQWDMLLGTPENQGISEKDPEEWEKRSLMKRVLQTIVGRSGTCNNRGIDLCTSTKVVRIF